MIFPVNISLNQQLEGLHVQSQLPEDLRQLTEDLFPHVIEDKLVLWFQTPQDRLKRMQNIWRLLLDCRAALREKCPNVKNIVFATWENEFLLAIFDELTTI